MVVYFIGFISTYDCNMDIKTMMKILNKGLNSFFFCVRKGVIGCSLDMEMRI